jgi:SAM-dependent methyltransferase
MPSVSENQVRWTEHPWAREGHEWSPGQTAAGGEMLWWRGLLPRIAAHLPTGRVLEIGPGFGRWTQHLIPLCERLTAVDLTARCIEHCRQKFAGAASFDAWTNDGESLDVVPDGSLDFVFSFDSLVHAEAPVLRAYLQQLSRKLKPGGTGFIHHSNLQAFAGEAGSLPRWLVRRNWRGESMSARRFREYCREMGLQCTSQEIINWISRSQKADRHRVPGLGLPLTDALSTFRRPLSAESPDPITEIYLNPGFADEWRQVVLLASIYGRRVPPPSSARAEPPRAISFTQRVREKAARVSDHASSYVRDHVNAVRVRRHEPIVNAWRGGRCPDCGSALIDHHTCEHCRTRTIV